MPSKVFSGLALTDLTSHTCGGAAIRHAQSLEFNIGALIITYSLLGFSRKYKIPQSPYITVWVQQPAHGYPVSCERSRRVFHGVPGVHRNAAGEAGGLK